MIIQNLFWPLQLYRLADFQNLSRNLNLNGLLVIRRIDNSSPGGGVRQEGNQSLALIRDANLDTQSSDISAEEIRESGRSLLSEKPNSVDFYNAFLRDKIICGYSGFTLQTFE